MKTGDKMDDREMEEEGKDRKRKGRGIGKNYLLILRIVFLCL
jgi:hypothetical protein